ERHTVRMWRAPRSRATDKSAGEVESLGGGARLLQVHGAAQQHAALPIQRDLAAAHPELHDPVLLRPWVGGMRTMNRRARSGGGQALVEFALVFPLFLLILMSVIVFGLYVFYNQQLQNAAREAARYAAIHSSTAQCPVVSQINPIGSNRVNSYNRCDAPENGW